MSGRITAFVLALCLLVGAAGCSGGDGADALPQGQSWEEQSGSGSEPSGPSQEAVPPALVCDVSDLKTLGERYLTPILFSQGTTKSWTDANALDAEGFVTMYGYAQVWNADIPERELIFEGEVPYYDADGITLEQYVQSYFDVSTDHLRSSKKYDPQKQTYRFNMSGVGFAYDPQVKHAEYDEAKKELILYIDGGFEENRDEAAALTIRLEQDGGFRYVSSRRYDP